MSPNEVTVPPVHSVPLANGEVITDQMSAFERYNIIAKSVGASPASRPAAEVFGPAGHPPTAYSPETVVADPATVAALNANYRKAYTAATTEAEQTALRATYSREMIEVMEGRVKGETSAQFKARQAGTAPAPAAPAPASAPTGWVAASKIPAEALHGYTVPRDMEYNAQELAGQLRAAKEAGLTQAQIDTYIKAERKRMGI